MASTLYSVCKRLATTSNCRKPTAPKSMLPPSSSKTWMAPSSPSSWRPFWSCLALSGSRRRAARKSSGENQGETSQQGAIVGVDGGGAAFDVAPVDHQHQHVVDAVVVDAFGSGFAGLVGARLDTELMRLHLPAPRPAGLHRREQRVCKMQDATHAGAFGEHRPHRQEPALDIALQGEIGRAHV